MRDPVVWGCDLEHNPALAVHSESLIPSPEITVISLDLGTEAIRAVLGGLRFPAPRWRIIAQAQHWGAGHLFLDELGQLPEGTYASLAELCAALKRQRAVPEP